MNLPSRNIGRKKRTGRRSDHVLFIFCFGAVLTHSLSAPPRLPTASPHPAQHPAPSTQHPVPSTQHQLCSVSSYAQHPAMPSLARLVDTCRQVNGRRFVRQKRVSERQNRTSEWLQIDMPRAGIRQSLRRYTPLNHTSAGRTAFFPECNAYLGHP